MQQETLSAAVVAAVGMWATLLRCPSCPQPGRRPCGTTQSLGEHPTRRPSHVRASHPIDLCSAISGLCQRRQLFQCSLIVPGVVRCGSVIKAVKMGTGQLDHGRNRNDKHCQNPDYDEGPFLLSALTSWVSQRETMGWRDHTAFRTALGHSRQIKRVAATSERPRSRRSRGWARDGQEGHVWTIAPVEVATTVPPG